MSRSSTSTACCSENLGLKKGPWTPEEDQKLLAYIEKHGFGNWRTLPEKAGLQRCGKSCRLRWINYLRPDVKRGKFSLQEEQTIIQLHAFLGNRWSAIAAHLPKRTDNEIKNYWNTHIKKRFSKMGIDPTTHKPKSDSSTNSGEGGGVGSQFRNTGTLSHMAQWERARLEAEARFVKESKKLSPGSQPAFIATRKRTKALSAAGPSSRSQYLDVLKAWQTVVSGMFGINNTNNDISVEPQPPTTFLEYYSNPISHSAEELDLTAAAGSLLTCNIGGIGENQQEDQLMMDDKSNQMLPELNERFDNSMCLHDATYQYQYQYWSTTAAAAGNMVDEVWDFSGHDFDDPIEQGNLR